MQSEGHSAKKRILVVDDSKSIRTLFKIYFKRLPVQMDFAEDGLAAIECLKKAKPDLILLDLMMPRMNGSQLLDFLNETAETRNIPRIVVSARQDQESLEELYRKGVSAFVPKPISMEALKPLVLDALENGSFRHEPSRNLDR